MHTPSVVLFADLFVVVIAFVHFYGAVIVVQCRRWNACEQLVDVFTGRTRHLQPPAQSRKPQRYYPARDRPDDESDVPVTCDCRSRFMSRFLSSLSRSCCFNSAFDVTHSVVLFVDLFVVVISFVHFHVAVIVVCFCNVGAGMRVSSLVDVCTGRTRHLQRAA